MGLDREIFFHGRIILFMLVLDGNENIHICFELLPSTSYVSCVALYVLLFTQILQYAVAAGYDI